MPVQCTCRTCGAVFSRKPSAVLNGEGSYCSYACKRVGLRQRTDDPCPHCGQQVKRRGTAAKYCSHACYVAASIRPLADRFWEKVSKSDGCWTWTANHLPKGYGVISVGGKAGRLELAHRMAWEMATGLPIPDGFDVCHNCPDRDTPACVRNDEPGIYVIRGIARPRFGHLWLGTNDDNMADMAIKARAKRQAVA